MHKLLNVITALFIGFVVWMIYLANTGGHSVFFNIVRTTRDGDKIGHFVLYGLAALGLNLSWRFRTVQCLGLRVYWGTLVVSIFVILEECSQAYIPNRTLDARDLYADAAGIFTFTVLTALIHLIVYLLNQKQSIQDSSGV